MGYSWIDTHFDELSLNPYSNGSTTMGVKTNGIIVEGVWS